MKKTVLFGAGQVGAMVSRLLGQDYRAVCFADNSESLCAQATSVSSTRVLSGEGEPCE